MLFFTNAWNIVPAVPRNVTPITSANDRSSLKPNGQASYNHKCDEGKANRALIMIIENEKQLTDAVVREMCRTENLRFREILESLVRHLHSFVREVRLTEEEFDVAIRCVTALGQHTTKSHNETRVMAGSLGISSLVCLLNNGDNGQTETSANLLGPFWRENSPRTPNGGSIVRSDTPGTPMFFKGIVKDKNERPVADAEVDVWHASPVGLYENEDPEQAEMNLRGKFRTDAKGIFAFCSVKPAGYPIPIGGPVGDLLRIQKRHPFRPAHLHALIYKRGYKTLASQIYDSDDPNLDSDAQFGVTKALIGHYQLHENEPAPDPAIKGNWYSLEHCFILEPGKSWLPTPPVSAKASVTGRGGSEITSQDKSTPLPQEAISSLNE